jgi:hypothetical protein
MVLQAVHYQSVCIPWPPLRCLIIPLQELSEKLLSEFDGKVARLCCLPTTTQLELLIRHVLMIHGLDVWRIEDFPGAG